MAQGRVALGRKLIIVADGKKSQQNLILMIIYNLAISSQLALRLACDVS